MKNAFLDIDGTLIDVSKRFYSVYRDTLKSYDFNYLDFENYWQLRKEAKSTEYILLQTCPRSFTKKYYSRRNEVFESLEYIDKYDQVIVKTETLELLVKNGYEIIVVSLRDNRANLISELRRFGIFPFVNAILTGSQFGDHNLKFKLIDQITSRGTNDFIIGDTEIDIRAGKKLNIKTIGVLSGIRNENLLISNKPDFLLKNINEIHKVDFITL